MNILTKEDDMKKRDYDTEIKSAQTVARLASLCVEIATDDSLDAGEKERLLHKAGLRAWRGL